MIRRQVGTIPKTLETKLEEGDFYEALQLYKSLHSRYEGVKKFKESDELLLHGIQNLNKHDQTIPAYDLAVMHFEDLKNRNIKFSFEIGDRFITIIDTFPASNEKEKLIGAFSSWCHSTGNSLVGYPKLNEFCGKYYWDQGKFNEANDFYILSENMNAYADLLLDWATHGYSSEVDLFITRPILLLCSKKNLRDANALLNAVMEKKKEDEEFTSLPLIHFCSFLLQTLTRDASPLFSLLEEKYDSELSRDPSFEKYMKTIGEVYYNIRPQGDMFSNMLRMFGGMH